ncbi:polyamine ABC transporter substrate-binding protein [Litoribrevibacter albus]|uniref:Spermidine/putrescine ABC transporter substrate-binding protein n=1 Tax=Litoribrevibacter albus TaxID=1473156 RepID=A0AA37W405_9GAMM|nr:spermidine/putrescine ABC transporter substrate-binding protein [Litoribrevibacter albus]GLQ29637.1 spermidine/putrescine ABC transporter substrate-binding protein [Litoribrevibacter albus]
MKRLLLLFVFLIMGRISSAETLTLYTWEEYISDDIVNAWEKSSGHTLKQIYFDNEEDRDALVASNTAQNIDLTIIDHIAGLQLGSEGMLQRVPTPEELPGLSHLDEQWRSGCGEHAIPYFWGTLGVVYRTDKIPTPPTSWKQLLMPDKTLSGHVGLFEDYTDLLAPALLLKGQSINTEDTTQLKEAFELIKQNLPKVLTFEYPVTFVDRNPKSDELYMALAYSGDQFTLNDRAGSEIWNYTTLQEGTITWLDCLAIVSSSKKRALAIDFLKHLYTLENTAKNSEDIYVATPSSQAKALQSQEFQDDLTVYPPQALLKKSQQYSTLSASNLYLRNRITSSLVKLHDSQ